MKSRHTAAKAVVLALLVFVFAGCHKGSKGGSSSSGDSSSGSSSKSPSAPADASPESSGSRSTPPPTNALPPASGTSGSEALITPPSLGAAYYFAALTPNGILHRTDAVIWGDVGYSYEGSGDEFGFSGAYSPAYSYTLGYPTFPDTSSASNRGTVFGSTHDDDGAYTSALADASLAYTDLAGRTADFTSTGPELSGLSLSAGVYSFDSDATLTGGTLTLNGSASDIWIFQIPGDLIVSGAGTVELIGGAVCSNVFWQVGAYSDYSHNGAIIGDDPRYGSTPTAYSKFQGTIISQGGIGVGRGSCLTGRALAIGPYYNSNPTPVSPDGFPAWYGTYIHYPTYFLDDGYSGWGSFCSAIIYGSVSILPTKAPSLGASNAFGALAKIGISATPVTTIGGSAGVSGPGGSAPTGLTADDVLPGTLYLTPGDAAVVTAMTAATSAGTDLATRDGDYDMRGLSLSGRTLPGGVYLIDSLTTFGGTITLDGRNDPASRWIFQGGDSTSLTLGTVTFAFARGSGPFDIYWRVGGVTLSAGAKVKGNFISGAGSISLAFGSEIQGRAFSLAGSISLTGSVIYREPSGHPVTGFNPPSLDHGALADEARSVATDGINMYVFGFQEGSGTGVNNKIRIEKRLLADGSLVLGFGSGGSIVEDPGLGEEIPRKILVDATSIYLIGSSEIAPLGTSTYRWRIEKRLLTTGALDSAFGTAGVITSTITGEGQDIAMDATYLYAVGEEDDGVTPGIRHIRVEKRDLITGAMASSYPVTDSSFDGGARSITLSSSFMMLGGWSNTVASGKDATFQKRFTSDGSLDTSYSFTGTKITTWSPGDDVIQSVENDGTFVYALLSIEDSGSPGTHLWSIQQWDMADVIGLNSYAYLFIPPIPSTSPTPDFSCAQLVVHGSALWISGNTIVGGDELWRIEKRSTVDLTLVPGFNSDGPEPGVVEINPSPGADKVWGTVYDGGILYSVGMDSVTGGGQWHISALNR